MTTAAEENSAPTPPFMVDVLDSHDPVDARALARSCQTPDGHPDPLRCALLLAGGPAAAENALAAWIGGKTGPAAAEQVAAEAIRTILDWPVRLTGAEAVTALLAAAGVSTAFIYAGTSELALGDAIEQGGVTRLINGRGDRECAFMAAGASLRKPHRGVAVLHGARGLTNALGAAADARRSEVGTLLIVGMPATTSARFQPPHGEPGLLEGLGGLVDWHWQAELVPPWQTERDRAAHRFVDQFRRALAFSARPPHRPAVFGLPQDVAEQRWLPLTALASTPVVDPPPSLDRTTLESALEALLRAQRPLFLADDYALRFSGIRAALDQLSGALGAPVLQVCYRRGPMLFERLRPDEVANFAGWWDPFNPSHQQLRDSCDLMVTVEDRNIYERVVGTLPDCRKIAVNTDPAKVRKNEYLGEKDVLLVGDPAAALTELTRLLEQRRGGGRAPWFSPRVRATHPAPEPVAAGVSKGRRAVTRAVAAALASWQRPVLVDDSQMFGGLLAEHYDEFPPGLRVFGGHGAFVGSGLPYATGLAIADRNVRVMCTLGDQAFTNSLQGLVAAVQERARVLYVVCNNGESVSLNKQGAASNGASPRRYLSNADGLRYHAVAQAFGVTCEAVGVPLGAPDDQVDAGIHHLSAALARAAAIDGPSMVELVLPSAPEVWAGIWLTHGFEQRPADATST